MESVNNKRYYHIHRANEAKGVAFKEWAVGETIVFDRNKKNYFNQLFDIYDIVFPNKIDDWGRLDKEKLLQLLNNNKDEAINMLMCLTRHYLKFTRECIFEEVRLKNFPELPSRFNCIWVLPENEILIKKWSNTFGGKGRIFLLELTGNIHRAKESYLKLTTNSLDKIRKMASEYWKQELNGGEEEEILFEGIVKIVAEKKIEDFS